MRYKECIEHTRENLSGVKKENQYGLANDKCKRTLRCTEHIRSQELYAATCYNSPRVQQQKVRYPPKTLSLVKNNKIFIVDK